MPTVATAGPDMDDVPHARRRDGDDPDGAAWFRCGTAFASTPGGGGCDALVDGVARNGGGAHGSNAGALTPLTIPTAVGASPPASPQPRPGGGGGVTITSTAGLGGGHSISNPLANMHGGPGGGALGIGMGVGMGFGPPIGGGAGGGGAATPPTATWQSAEGDKLWAHTASRRTRDRKRDAALAKRTRRMREKRAAIAKRQAEAERELEELCQERPQQKRARGSGSVGGSAGGVVLPPTQQPRGEGQPLRGPAGTGVPAPHASSPTRDLPALRAQGAANLPSREGTRVGHRERGCDPMGGGDDGDSLTPFADRIHSTPPDGTLHATGPSDEAPARRHPSPTGRQVLYLADDRVPPHTSGAQRRASGDPAMTTAAPLRAGGAGWGPDPWSYSHQYGVVYAGREPAGGDGAGVGVSMPPALAGDGGAGDPGVMNVCAPPLCVGGLAKTLDKRRRQPPQTTTTTGDPNAGKRRRSGASPERTSPPATRGGGERDRRAAAAAGGNAPASRATSRQTYRAAHDAAMQRKMLEQEQTSGVPVYAALHDVGIYPEGGERGAGAFAANPRYPRAGWGKTSEFAFTTPRQNGGHGLVYAPHTAAQQQQQQQQLSLPALRTVPAGALGEGGGAGGPPQDGLVLPPDAHARLHVVPTNLCSSCAAGLRPHHGSITHKDCTDKACPNYPKRHHAAGAGTKPPGGLRPHEAGGKQGKKKLLPLVPVQAPTPETVRQAATAVALNAR